MEPQGQAVCPQLHRDIASQDQASTSTTAEVGGGFEPLQFTTSFPMPNLASYTLPKVPPLSVAASGDIGTLHYGQQPEKMDMPVLKRKR